MSSRVQIRLSEVLEALDDHKSLPAVRGVHEAAPAGPCPLAALSAMPRDDLYEEYWALLVAAAARIGIPLQKPYLLRLHSNALFALPSAGLVIRIATNPAAVPRVTAAVGITLWLAAQGFPCVIPADIGEQPLTVDGRAVSVWRYIPPSARQTAAVGCRSGAPAAQAA